MISTGRFTSHTAPKSRYTLQEAAARLQIGDRALFRALRRRRVLDARNVPAPRYKDAGYLFEHTGTYKHPAAGIRFYSRTFVTPDGLAWLRRLLAEQGEVSA